MHRHNCWFGGAPALLMLLLAFCCAPRTSKAFTDDYGPKLMAYQGCSISSPSYNVGRALIEAHTERHVVRLSMEELRIQKNKYASSSYGLKKIEHAVDAEIVAALKHNEIFYSKLEHYKLEHQSDPELMKVLHFHGAKVVNTYRRNALDFLICLIRDCFGGKGFGYAVLEDGTPSDLCFGRRAPGSPKVYAYLNVTMLGAGLRKFMNLGERQAEGLYQAGFTDFTTVATEDLMAFGMTEDGMEHSVDTWCKFLLSLGIHPDKGLIQKVLQGDLPPTIRPDSCGGWHNACTPAAHPEKPHTDSIYNFKEVADALHKLGNTTFLSFLRHHETNKELVNEDT